MHPQDCPADVRKQIIQWLMLAYLGEVGGVTSWGNVRHVFYSNCAAPLVEELISASVNVVRDDVREAAKSRIVQKAVKSEDIQRRLDSLLDLIEEGAEDR